MIMITEKKLIQERVATDMIYLLWRFDLIVSIELRKDLFQYHGWYWGFHE